VIGDPMVGVVYHWLGGAVLRQLLVPSTVVIGAGNYLAVRAAS
jgi:hypothetical protein